MVTYNVMMDIAFSLKECKDPDGKTATPQQIREAILTRLASLDDAELTEAIGVCDSYEEETPIYRMSYKCTCGEKWEMEHDCCCNDRCPKCDTEIEPHNLEDL